MTMTDPRTPEEIAADEAWQDQADTIADLRQF